MDNWYSKVVDICFSEGLEPLRDPGDVLKIVGAKIPTKKIQDEIKSLIPEELTVIFVKGPKNKHLLRIMGKIQEIGLKPIKVVFVEGHMGIQVMGDEGNPYIKELKETVLEDSSIKTVSVSGYVNV